MEAAMYRNLHVFRAEEPRQAQPNTTYRIPVTTANGASLPEVQDGTVPCFVILLTFWFLVSLTLILGYYGSVELAVGPGCSRLVQASSAFVQDIEVRVEEGSGGDGLVLYGLPVTPTLDVPAAWFEAHHVVVPSNFHREWIYFLNKGAQIEISYSVKSETEGTYDPLCIIISQDKESLARWLEKPLMHNTTFSWNLVHGNGTVKQAIDLSSDYYIAVGNFNNQDMTVLLDFRIRTFFYNTTGADYRCSPGHALCTYSLPFLEQNVAVLSSGLTEQLNSDEQYVKLSYKPRWVAYIVGSVIMTVALLLVYEMLNTLVFGPCTESVSTSPRSHSDAARAANQRAPLLSDKDDDNASLGSSYESVSHDEEDVEGRASGNSEGRHLCVVCCDARKDCFFLPCGHSATCYACGNRISEEDGYCPFCRRKLKKVKRIFTV